MKYRRIYQCTMCNMYHRDNALIEVPDEFTSPLIYNGRIFCFENPNAKQDEMKRFYLKEPLSIFKMFHEECAYKWKHFTGILNFVGLEEIMDEDEEEE